MLRSRVAVLEEELALIREQLAWLKKQVFGRKTEQSSVIMDNGQQLTLFPEEQGQSANLQLQICNSAHKRFIICYNGIVSRRADEAK